MIHTLTIAVCRSLFALSSVFGLALILFIFLLNFQQHIYQLICCLLYQRTLYVQQLSSFNAKLLYRQKNTALLYVSL